MNPKLLDTASDSVARDTSQSPDLNYQGQPIDTLITPYEKPDGPGPSPSPALKILTTTATLTTPEDGAFTPSFGDKVIRWYVLLRIVTLISADD